MDPVTAVVLAGGVIEGVGNLFSAFSNLRKSKLDVEEARLQANQADALRAQSTALATDRLTGDINRAVTQQSGQIVAGAAASGVRSSSGSAQAVLGDVQQEGARQLDLGLRSISINDQQMRDQIAAARRSADRQEKARWWNFAGDLLGVASGGMDTATMLMGDPSFNASSYQGPRPAGQPIRTGWEVPVPY